MGFLRGRWFGNIGVVLNHGTVSPAYVICGHRFDTFGASVMPNDAFPGSQCSGDAANLSNSYTLLLRAFEGPHRAHPPFSSMNTTPSRIKTSLIKLSVAESPAYL